MGDFLSSYELSIVTIVGINIILALGLNLITGMCGQISLGHAAFYAIGAYTAGVMLRGDLSIWLVLPAATIFGGVAGVIVGISALRVRDDSLSIATMAVGLIVYGYVRHNDFLGGELGITFIRAPWSRETLGLVCIGSALAVALLCIYIKQSWLGFAFRGVSVDDQAVRTIGVDDHWYKIIAFSLGTAMAGYAGALFTLYLRSVGPEAFGVGTSFALLPMIILGGLGSVWGCVIASTLITIFPEFSSFANDYKQLIFGLLLVVVVFVFPGGLAGIPKQLGLSGRRSRIVPPPSVTAAIEAPDGNP
jgi:branched-chain amino acid transport system permease protein